MSAVHPPSRGSWQITYSVWRALFLREFVSRMATRRFGWLWLFLEPILFVLIMLFVRYLLGRVRFIIGADFIPWLIVGLVTFFMFRNGLNRGMAAIDANRGLFAYRQVKPVDTVLVRGVLEGVLMSVVLVLLVLGAAFFGHTILPDDGLRALVVWLSVWLLGLGLGLIASVGATLITEIGIVVRMLTLPLMLLSGVIIPVMWLPHSIQQYLLYNPVLHGIEAIRLGFFQDYYTLADISLLYLQLWGLSATALGLVLQAYFAKRLLAK